RPSAYALAAATPTSSAPASPGPAVTATASTSESFAPACASAASTVGVMASRWAREATSGTTPPNRACSSMLDATVLASSVWPRTRPMPVSSQDVSMPRTRGASAIQLPSHHDRVGAVVVVAAAGADGLEPEPLVQASRHRVVLPDLQEDLACPAPARLGQQLGEHGGPDAGAPMGLGHGDRLHVGLVAGRRHPGVPDDRPADDGHHVVPGARLVGQLTAHHALAPRVERERGLLDGHDLGQIPLGHLPEPHTAHVPGRLRPAGHAVTFFGAPGTAASGRRR